MIAQSYKDQLNRIKKNIETAEMHWKENNQRYHEFQRFVFQTAITQTDQDTLLALGKPLIEFNITNAPLSRMCGEFSKQIPSIEVRPASGAEVDPAMIEVIEGHMRHIFEKARKTNTQYNVYRDQLSGGFSSFKVWTEYEHPKSFQQEIRFGRVFDPTMAGYDPMAREVDKRDAAWCYELYPMKKQEFKDKWPDADLTDVAFTQMDNQFNWSYAQGSDQILVVCHYYETKKKKTKLLELADGTILTKREHENFLEEWSTEHFLEIPPLVKQERWTDIETVCRYTLMMTEVLEYEETPFLDNPLIFVDGDSVIIKKGNDSANMTQFTKPYVYHAKGIQRLTNFSGQCIANDMEMMVMHKFKVAKEGIPQEQEFQDAYTNVQQASTLVYNAFMDNDPNKPVPPPMEISRVPLPQEVTTTFNTSMQMLQNILGTYDSQLGINDNQLSGIAIVEAATQSNSTGMPYIVNYMQSLTQVANVILKIIPKYYVTPRTLPVLDKEGNRSYVKINQPGGIPLKYDPSALNVTVEAGPSFAIQKSKALQQITALSQSNQRFAAFINEEGLPYLLDNMEFKGVEVLRERAKEWMQREKEAAMKQQQQPTPEMIQAQMAQAQMQLQQQEMQRKAEESELDAQVKREQILVDKMKVDNERLDILIKAGIAQDKFAAELARAQAEETRAQTDLHIKLIDVSHKHAKDVAAHHRDMIHLSQPKYEKKESE